MKIFLSIGDSISTVRPNAGLTEKDLYTYKLQKKLGSKFYVVNKAKAGNNITLCISEDSMVYSIQAASADFFSIQIGIVDCAPRIYTENEKKIIEKLINFPLMGKYIKSRIRAASLRRYELTQDRSIQLTSPELFESYYRILLANIKKYNNIKCGFLINIGAPGEHFSSKYWNVEENIVKLNQIINKIAEESRENIHVIDLYKYTKNHGECILNDGHHYDSNAHTFISDSIYTVLEKKL